MQPLKEIIRVLAYTLYRRMFARFYRAMDAMRGEIADQSAKIAGLGADRDALHAQTKSQHQTISQHEAERNAARTEANGLRAAAGQLEAERNTARTEADRRQAVIAGMDKVPLWKLRHVSGAPGPDWIASELVDRIKLLLRIDFQIYERQCALFKQQYCGFLDGFDQIVGELTFDNMDQLRDLLIQNSQ